MFLIEDGNETHYRDWYSSAPAREIDRLNSVVKAASSRIGSELNTAGPIIENLANKKVENIMKDNCHLASDLFQFLPSGQRVRSIGGTGRYTNSFFPAAIRLHNSNSSR